ncbi:FAST kinase domain-containing protein 5, mitochondrial [Microplitis mediator]|uniref:FAST kinase domain-containing protein 5, mitochondrial n=1 Tax=Microplitis mediator TaxID=375433 RepID=UPI002556A1B2|nr:FAST kinase domain-containing protein 5, mitochondrial [Microplitis mediator]
MFSKNFKTLINIHEQLSRLRFHSAAITRQVNLKVLASKQSKITISLYKNNVLTPVVYQSKKYSNLSSQCNETTNEHDSDEDEVYGTDKSERTLRLTENLYAYTLLKNSDKMGNIIVPLLIPDEDIPEDVVQKIIEKNHEDSSPAEVLEDFRLLSYHRGKLQDGVLSPEKHSNILNTLKKYLADFSDDQLWNLLRYIELWYPMQRSTKEPLLIELEKAMDQECHLRSNLWSVDDIMKTCDLWYHLRYARQSRFVSKWVKKLGKRSGKLKAEHYLYYMFLINIARKLEINMYELEYRLEKFIDKFNGNELGIVAMGFFKTRTPIRNPDLLDKMIETSVKDMHEMGEISIAAVMKITRLSMGLNTLWRFKKLLHAFQPRIKDISVGCLVHAAHAAATVLVYEKDIIDEIINSFIPHLSAARLKDLERMLFSLVIFNYPKELPLYNLIIDQLKDLRRTSELKKFPRSLTVSLMYLSQADIYPLELISIVLSPKFLKEVYNNNAFRIGRECLIINEGLKIEVPDYKGPFLPEKISKYLTTRYSASILDVEDPTEKVQSYQKFIFEFVSLLKEVIGSKDFLVEQTLPHFQRADIIMCIDDQNNIVSPASYFPKSEVGSIKYAPKEPVNLKWLAIVLASSNHTFRNTNDPCGTMQAKLRQLRRIGYTPVMVPYNTWYGKLKSLDAKKNYIRECLLQHGVNKISTS